MNSRSRFFEELVDGLPNDSWGQRLQEELDAHLEDAVLFATLEGIPEPDAERDAVTRLGSPKQIIHEFRHAMTYKSLSAFVLHAVAVGLLVSPVVYFMILLAHSPVLLPAIFGVLYAFYSFGLRPVMRHIEGRKLRVQLAAIASLIPITLIGVPMMIHILNPAFNAPADRTWLSLGFFLAAGLTIAAAMTATWKPISKTKENLVQNLSFVLLGLIVLLMGIVQGPVPNDLNIFQKIRFLASSAITAPNAIAEILSPVSAAWVSGAIVLGTGLIALFFVIQSLNRKRQGEKESFPWAWSVVAVFTLSLVFFPGKASTLEGITWAVPHTKLSETIERSELGPFYEMVEYLNQGNSNSFNYFISVEDGAPENGFIVKQYPNRVFAISNMQSVDSFTITDLGTAEMDGAAMNQADVWCHQKSIPGAIVEITDTDGNVAVENVDGQVAYLANQSPLYCSDLYVGEKKIFDAPNGINFGFESTVTINDNGTWMLWKHDTDGEIHATLSPEEIYLIDLR